MLNWNVFDIVFFMFLAANFVIRWPHIKVSRATKITKAQVDLRERFGLCLAFLGGMFLPLAYLFTPLFNFADYEVSPLAGWIGVALCIPSLWIFIKAHQDLGRQWSPKLELRESHLLIAHGIYKYVRHPMYTAIFLASLAQQLLVGNWLVGPSYLIGFCVLYFARIEREEALLMNEFGAEYAAYKARTNRLFSPAFLRAFLGAGK
jgi:protein-S-isoprenylcysteine O-methyltransferase Ste14